MPGSEPDDAADHRDRRSVTTALPLTYAEVGRTLGELPAGWDHAHRSVRLGRGDAVFTRASECVLSFAMHRRAGVRVRTTGSHATVGLVVRLGVGLGPFRLSAPCGVVAVVDEPRRAGFAYGTLFGHPVRGEELFLVEHQEGDAVVLTVRAFSRPATWWARLAGPVVRRGQARTNRRYQAAALDLVRSGSRS
jgi:uncharacterized protein (UPF0548 family)